MLECFFNCSALHLRRLPWQNMKRKEDRKQWFIDVLIFHLEILPHCLCSTWGCSVLLQCSHCRPAALVQGQNHAHTGGKEEESVTLVGKCILHTDTAPALKWFKSVQASDSHLMSESGGTSQMKGGGGGCQKPLLVLLGAPQQSMAVQRGTTIGLTLKEGIYSNCFKLLKLDFWWWMIFLIWSTAF